MNSKFELLKQICKEHNVKLTYQRLEIFQEIISSKTHPSVEDIYNIVKQKIPTISIDTVYRTLNSFYSWGLISKVHLFSDKTIFDPEIKPHHHMLCIKCKEIKDFIWPEFDNIKLPEIVEFHGDFEYRYTEVRGICNKCMKNNSADKS